MNTQRLTEKVETALVYATRLHVYQKTGYDPMTEEFTLVVSEFSWLTKNWHL